MSTSANPLHNATAAWREADRKHHLHPFTDAGGLAKEGGPRIIVKAEGNFLTDSEGHQILDGMAGLWCVNVGYGRKELAEAAYNQMLELPYYNTFFKTATPPSIELAEKLAQITPEGLEHVFYGSSGSESNDTVVRMVRHFWNLKGKREKKVIISREYAYHGSTCASASLGGMTAMHEQADLPIPGIEHVMPPYWFDFGKGMDKDLFGRMAAKAVEDKILELGADKVAAFIAEPIMGAGGVIVPPESYWPEIQRICKQHDVLLVADEVICGFGRTGEWFASHTLDIKPDLMTMAKGITSGYLPLSGLMVGDRVAEALIEGGEFFHGYTYSGHPVACAVALKNIEIIEREGLVEKVREETGPYLQEGLQSLTDHPLVGEARGLGLFGAVELVKDKETHERYPDNKATLTCRKHCIESGLMLRQVRDSMICSPPLTFDKVHVDELVSKLRAALDATAKELGAA
jgi:putrescine aminotransferase